MFRNLGLGVLCVVGVLGCGAKSTTPATAKTTGVVTYNGAPVKGATVTFANDKSPRAGSGVTNDQGAFIISTFGIDDGAIVGEHTVTVSKQSVSAEVAAMKPEDYMKAMQGAGGGAGGGTVAPPGQTNKSELPTKYANSGSSGLKFTVEAGKENQFKIELTD